MPYIPQPDRDKLDDAIADLAREIRMMSTDAPETFAGRLNYAVMRLMLESLPARRYWAIATATGVLRNVSDEFYRRYAVPYEAEQIAKNGDLTGLESTSS